MSRSQRSGFSSVHPTVCGSLELVALPQPLVRARAASCAPACRAACVERAQAHTAPSTHTHTSTPRAPHPPPEIRWSHFGISAAFVLQNPHRPPPCLAQFQGNSPCFASSKSKVSLLSSASLPPPLLSHTRASGPPDRYCVPAARIPPAPTRPPAPRPPAAVGRPPPNCLLLRVWRCGLPGVLSCCCTRPHPSSPSQPPPGPTVF